MGDVNEWVFDAVCNGDLAAVQDAVADGASVRGARSDEGEELLSQPTTKLLRVVTFRGGIADDPRVDNTSNLLWGVGNGPKEPP